MLVFADAQFSLEETLGECRTYTWLKWTEGNMQNTHLHISQVFPIHLSSQQVLQATLSTAGATTFCPISDTPASTTS